MPLTEEAIATLRRVQAEIRAEPEKLDMDRWYRMPGQEWVETHMGVIEVIDGTSVPDVPLVAVLQQCGTAACIAGHYVAQMGERALPGETIEETATRDLGVSENDARALFFTSHWPATLREMFEGNTIWVDDDDPIYDGIEATPDDLPAPEVRAEAACRAIDVWISVNGNERRFVNAAVRD